MAPSTIQNFRAVLDLARPLSEALSDIETAVPGRALRQLLALPQAWLPLPAQGDTLARWRGLASVAAHDLSVLKLYEGHTDAAAILDELGGNAPQIDEYWGVWAAEAPHAVLKMKPAGNGKVLLSGRKAWCSGAHVLTHAVLTVRNDDLSWLVAVDLRQPGVHATHDGWHAVGMGSTASVDVDFDQAIAVPVGRPGAYLDRPGFWQGGAGIAACWYGAATALADALREACRRKPDDFRLAHLGAVNAALTQAAASLREAAAWIDDHPHGSARRVALQVRAAAESAATATLEHVGRALGATPYCRDGKFARMAADLPVFLRQSHAERDLAALGKLVEECKESPWAL